MTPELTPAQVAKRLGYRSSRFVRTMIVAGVMPATCHELPSGRKEYTVSESQLAEFVASYHPIQRGRPRGKPMKRSNLKKS
jgi:hypothetical protein